VLFVVLLGLAMGGEKQWTVSSATLFFLQQGLGGVLLGFVMGGLAARLLRTIDNAEVAISLTLGMVAGGYAFAHSVMQVSGPICMAVAGLSVGNLVHNGNMSKHTLKRLNAFWELLDEVLNAILFVTIGLEFLSLSFGLDTALASVGAIIITMMARWLSVMLPVASVSMFRKFSPNIVLIMTWGGLRGGISIALALTLPYGSTRDFILAITYAVVLFSIMVQGLTLGGLVRRITKLKTFQEEHPEELLLPAQSRLSKDELA
jgi:CPA1 family monovalent cation:H+ antiporter